MPNPVENIASKAMGAMKGGKAALEGLRGVFRKLAQEHGEVAALLMRVKSSSDPKVRADLFPKIRNELLSHEKAEMTIVYPAFREFPETVDIAEKHDREAGALRNQLDLLNVTVYDDPSWTTQFEALVDLVQRHVAEEEGDFFPKGQKLLGDRAEELQKEFEEVKSAALAGLG